MAFTCDEVWSHVLELGALDNDVWSVHLSDWPAAAPRGAIRRWRLNSLSCWPWDERDARTGRKRKTGMMGAGLEAAVVLQCSDPAVVAVLEKHAAELPALFIVSQVRLAGAGAGDYVAGQEVTSLTMRIEQAQGGKCARCWNFSGNVGTICGTRIYVAVATACCPRPALCNR